MAARSISSFLLHSWQFKSLIGAQPRPSLLPNFSFLRSISSNTSTAVNWTSPQRVNNITTLADTTHNSEGRCHKHEKYWLVTLDTDGLKFANEKSLFDHYIKTLATVVGSEETAKRKIYLVSCGRNFGFGAEFDEETKSKLEVQPGVAVVLEDNHNDARNKDPTVRSVTPFSLLNWNHRLDDIYSYCRLSERNPKWRSDHWLVHIKKPDSGFDTEQQVVDYCVQMLSTVLGSEEKAKKKIYIVWCKMPFGFGAEIDEKTSNKLKALPNALTVLPDYAFDVKNKDSGALVLPRAAGLKSEKLQYYYYWLDKLLNEGVHKVGRIKTAQEITG